MLAFSIVMWVATKPFRHLTAMVNPDRTFATAAGAVGTTMRSAGRGARRVGAAAAGAFIGGAGAAVATDALRDDGRRAEPPPERAEGRTEPATTAQAPGIPSRAAPALAAAGPATETGPPAPLEPAAAGTPRRPLAPSGPAGVPVEAVEPVVVRHPNPQPTTDANQVMAQPSETHTPEAAEPAWSDDDEVYVIYHPTDDQRDDDAA